MDIFLEKYLNNITLRTNRKSVESITTIKRTGLGIFIDQVYKI